MEWSSPIDRGGMVEIGLDLHNTFIANVLK
jgi:hypothetical protein